MNKYGSFFLPRGGGGGSSRAAVNDVDEASHQDAYFDVDQGGSSNDESTSLLQQQDQEHELRHRQPLPLAIDDEDEESLPSHFHESHSLRRRRSMSRVRASGGGGVLGWWAVTLALSLLTAALTLSLYESIPSTHEMHLVTDYDLSYWDIPRLRSAQALALQSASFLQDADAAFQDGKTVVHKITKHKSSSEHHSYMNPPEGCESTVVIVRHCEKGSVREHCAHVGFERAVFLSTLFGDRDHDRWPAPAFIFAEGPGQRRNQRKMNFREMETVGPLADKVGVKVDDRSVLTTLGCVFMVHLRYSLAHALNSFICFISYSTDTVNDLAREILTVLQSGQMCVVALSRLWSLGMPFFVSHHFWPLLLLLVVVGQVREGDPHLVEAQQHRPPRAPARLRVRSHVCRFSLDFVVTYIRRL
jgi:hypothetical protein